MITNQTLKSETLHESVYYALQDAQDMEELNLWLDCIKNAGNHFTPEQREELTRQAAAKQIQFHQTMLNELRNN